MTALRRALSVSGMLLVIAHSNLAFQSCRAAKRFPVWRYFASASTLTDSESGSSSLASFTVNNPSPSSPHQPSIILKRSKQSKAFRNGNPLVFTRAIKQQITLKGSSSIKIADLVHVLVEPDKPDQSPHGIGFGVYNPESLYKIRILCHRYMQPQLYAQVLSVSPSDGLSLILKHHLAMARIKRLALGLGDNDSATSTDTFRLVHGEGDGLSGLAVDIVGPNVAVVMSSAAWCQVHRETIERALEEVLATSKSKQTPTIVWKTTPSRLLQDGYAPVDDGDSHITTADGEGSLDIAEQKLAMNGSVICMENGIKYQTHPFASVGQKTGVYCDQRENRWNLAQLCNDKRVLDLCCYHGGFALNALVNGGAKEATLVDSSADAITVCRENAHLNDCIDKTTLVHADITEWMQAAFRRDENFDVVVLDPPKLAPSEKLLEKARRKYHGINRDAIKLVSQVHGGLLLTCTCSAAMTQKDGGQCFLDMVHGAALAAGRQVTLMRVSGAASCHTQSPVAWPAGAYLTAALFFVHPTHLTRE
ncbi:hypothetical protein MPSEU_000150700 [Mayamaea pseudoterrestris]|nr:hypothetical protein MPSEU_000150700 [Mayamaea pseudoterrestris]